MFSVHFENGVGCDVNTQMDALQVTEISVALRQGKVVDWRTAVMWFSEI